jgi:hypothetical protein
MQPEKCLKCGKQVGVLINFEGESLHCPGCLAKGHPAAARTMVRMIENGKQHPLALQNLVESRTVQGGGYCPGHETFSVDYIVGKDGKLNPIEVFTQKAILKQEYTIQIERKQYCLSCALKKFPDLVEVMMNEILDKLPVDKYT